MEYEFVKHVVEDIDYNYKWHYIFETGSSTLQIFKSDIDNTDDDLFLNSKPI